MPEVEIQMESEVNEIRDREIKYDRDTVLRELKEELRILKNEINTLKEKIKEG